MKRWSHISAWRRVAAISASVVAFLLVLTAGLNLSAFLINALLGPRWADRAPFIRDFCLLLLWISASVGAIAAARWIHRAALTYGDDDETACCGNCGYNLTGNVSGRCPECGMDSVSHLAGILARRERRHVFKTVAMLLFGLPLSLLGPLVVATMLWLPLWCGFRWLSFAQGVLWLDIFVALTVIMIPSLFWMEIRSPETYQADLSGPAPRPGRVLTCPSIGVFMVNPRTASTALVEFFVIGPRLVVSGLHQRKLARSVRLDDRTRAAAILERLSRRDDGIDTKHLLRERETLDTIQPALAHLLYHQWIGVGEKWQRVWLLSEARQTLNSSP